MPYYVFYMDWASLLLSSAYTIEQPSAKKNKVNKNVRRRESSTSLAVALSLRSTSLVPRSISVDSDRINWRGQIRDFGTLMLIC